MQKNFGSITKKTIFLFAKLKICVEKYCWAMKSKCLEQISSNKVVININKYIKYSKALNHNGLKLLNSFNSGVHFVYEHFWQLIV